MGAAARKPHREDWRPNPGPDGRHDTGPQWRFLSLTCQEALYGGAAGGGKSVSLLVDAIRYVGRGYGSNYKAILLRREFPDLERSLWLESFKLYPRLGGKPNAQKHVWTFPSGEMVFFGHCQHVHDVHQYQGAEFQFIGFDELTHFTEYQYRYLMSRLRSARGVPCRMRAATNPGGVGHEWVFRRFAPWLDPSHPEPAEAGKVLYFVPTGDGETEGERIVDKGEPGSIGRTFIPAKLEDNPHLATDGQYKKALEQLDRVTREQLLRGNWLIRRQGLIFDEFDEQIHAVDTVPAPSAFRRVILAMDFGWTAPGCALVIGDLGGRYVVLDEFYRGRMVFHDPRIEAQAKAQRASGQDPGAVTWVYTVQRLIEEWSPHGRAQVFCDPAEPDKITDLVRNGIAAMPADNEILHGLRAINTALHVVDGRPALTISKRCVNLLREMRSYTRGIDKGGNPTDLPAPGQEDHAVDPLRYGLAELMRYASISPTEPGAPPDPQPPRRRGPSTYRGVF